MSDVTRCSVCRGKKTVLGLGGLQKKCTNCKGIGFVSVKEPEDKSAKKVSKGGDVVVE